MVMDKKEVSAFLKQARDLFREGEVLLKKDKKKADEKIQEALTISLKIIEVSPNTLEAYEMASQIFLRQGDRKSFLYYQKGYQYIKTGGFFPEPEAPQPVELKHKKKEVQKESLVPIPPVLLSFPYVSFKEPASTFASSPFFIPAECKNIQQTALPGFHVTLKLIGKNKPEQLSFSQKKPKFTVSQSALAKEQPKVKLYQKNKMPSPSFISRSVNSSIKMREIISAAINPIPMMKLEAAAKWKNFHPIIPTLRLMKQNLTQPGRTAVINTYFTFPKKQMQVMGKFNLSFFNKPPKLRSGLKEFSALLPSPSKVSIAKFKATSYDHIPVLIQNIFKNRFSIQEAKLVEKPLTKFLLRQKRLKEIAILYVQPNQTKLISRLNDFANPVLYPVKPIFLNLKPFPLKAAYSPARKIIKPGPPPHQRTQISTNHPMIRREISPFLNLPYKKTEKIFLYQGAPSSKIFASPHPAVFRLSPPSYQAIGFLIKSPKFYQIFPYSSRLLRTRRANPKENHPTKNYIIDKTICVSQGVGKIEVLFLLRSKHKKLLQIPIKQLSLSAELRIKSILPPVIPYLPGILWRKGAFKLKEKAIAPLFYSKMNKKAPIQLQMQFPVLAKSFKFFKMPEISPVKESILDKIDSGEHPLYLFALELDKNSDELMLEGNTEEAVHGYLEGAMALIEAGELQGAAEMLEKALKGKPDDLEILKKLNKLQIQGAILKPGIKLEIQRKIYGLKI